MCHLGRGPRRAGADAAEGSEGEDDAPAAGGTDVQEAEAGTRQQGREVRRTRSAHDRSETEVRGISRREFAADPNTQINQVSFPPLLSQRFLENMKYAGPLNYRPQTKLRKGNVLHLSVSHSVHGGCLPQCMLGYTPPGRHSPGQTPFAQCMLG